MHYSRRTWCCPFFMYDEKGTIHCEGGSRFKMKDKEIYASFADKYCGDPKGWRKCPIAHALWKLYDPEGEP